MSNIAYKINVFLSSRCDGKYSKMRKELKGAIESTGFAKVYVFEEAGASCCSSEEHYLGALSDSHVAFFIIDNEDGISKGVQREIDFAFWKHIKSFFIFCDEHSSEKTPLEKRLMGAKGPKFKTIHRFDEIAEKCLEYFLNDLVQVFILYCKNNFDFIPAMDEESVLLEAGNITSPQLASFPKILLGGILKCTQYFYRFLFDRELPMDAHYGHIKTTSRLDDCCLLFMPILFEGESIGRFNPVLLFEELEKLQDTILHEVVKLRWKGIQAYFLGDIGKSVEMFTKALEKAKSSNCPLWIINDIRLDLRNAQYALHEYAFLDKTEVQKEIQESPEEIYFPMLDRISENLDEKYLDGMYEKKIAAPFTIFGTCEGIDFSEAYASYAVIAMYYGSLTHILRLYDKLKKTMFYLCSRYDAFMFRVKLFRFSVFSGNASEVGKVVESYPEILNAMDAGMAVEIMEFCRNEPVAFRRESLCMLAFGQVAYYLSDEDYERFECQIIKLIEARLLTGTATPNFCSSIVNCLDGIKARISMTKFAQTILACLTGRFRGPVINLFNLIDKGLDLRLVDEDVARQLVDRISQMFESESTRDDIRMCPGFLASLRRQDEDITKELDTQVAKYLPKFYSGTYLVAIGKSDLQAHLSRYIDNVQKNAISLGKGGMFSPDHGYFGPIRAMLKNNVESIPDVIWDAAVDVAVETIVDTPETVLEKTAATALLQTVLVIRPDVFERNRSGYVQLKEAMNRIEIRDSFFLEYDSAGFRAALALLFSSMQIDTYPDLMELMPRLKDNPEELLILTGFLVNAFDARQDFAFAYNVEELIFQNALTWIDSSRTAIRMNSLRILLAILRNTENRGIRAVVNHKLISIVDNDNLHLKTLLLGCLDTEGIEDGTRSYILQRCSNDPNYVVRMGFRKLIGDQKKASYDRRGVYRN